MTKAPPPVWRVSLLWQGTVLDTASVRGKSSTLTLRTGEAIKARVLPERDGAAAALELSGPRLLVTLSAGQFCVLPAGHVLHADVDGGVAVARGDGGVDSTLLHSTMIGVALQVCVVSALWLAPVSSSSDTGAGIPSEAKRLLSLPGGTASVVGRASFAARGRKPDEAEKIEPLKKKGAPLPQRAGRMPSLEQTLEAMKAALHPGDAGELRESLGQIARTEARAPQLGAGVGGLSPKDPVDTGPGAGVIGAGTNVALTDLIRRRVDETEKRTPTTTTTPPTTFPVTMQEVPDAAVDAARIDADPELDPLVREHLTRAIRSRHNVIRGCYSAWGLAADARRSGRLVVELTLLPDGHVSEIEATTSTTELRMVADCVVRAASEWYLGDGLVTKPTRLAFPFVLQPAD